MKRSLINLFMIVIVLSSLIGSAIQVVPVKALGDATNESPTFPPANWKSGKLESVWGTPDASRIFAVGSGIPLNSTLELPLIYQSSGGGWTSMPLTLPSPTTGFTDTWITGSLMEVWGISGTDVYAVGFGGPAGITLPLVYHYDGSSWTAIPLSLPALPAFPDNWTSGRLWAVWGTSGTDIYAVGDGGPSNNALPLLYHYDGTNWIPTPLSGNGVVSLGHLQGIWGSSTNNIYAVGYGSGGSESAPLLYHYGRASNGALAWQEQSSVLPTAGWNSGKLEGVWGTSTDVYMVGQGDQGNGTVPLVYHYGSSGWDSSSPALPTTAWHDGFLYEIWGAGTAVYAVGKGNNGTGDAPLLYRKTSSGWAAFSPSPTGTEWVGWTPEEFDGVWWGTDPYKVYAVGTGDKNGTLSPLIARFGHDAIAPGPVTNLKATSGASRGTVILSWTAPADDSTNPNSGPVDSYIVRYSTSPISACNVGLPVTSGLPTPVTPGTPQVMTASVPTPGATYYFAVCAQDEEPNPSTPLGTDAVVAQTHFPLGAGTYDDTYTAWQYTGHWNVYNGGGPYNNTMHYTDTADDAAELTFNGVQFILTMQRSTNRGNIGVYVDGYPAPLATINANGPELWQWTWTSPRLKPGPHKLRLKFAGGGTYMDIDAIQIIGSPTTLGPGAYDDTNSAWLYTGSWSLYNAGGPANNTMHYTATAGDSAEVTFNGTQFILAMQRNSNRGLIDVYMDGSSTKLTTIDPNGPLMWMWQWTSPLLQAGVHTARLVFTGAGGSYMDIDVINIIGPLEPGVYDDTHSAFKYTGNWSFYNAAGPAGNTMHYTSTVGDAVEMTFNGIQLVLTMQRSTNRGNIAVYVDGSSTALATINANGPELWQWTWASPVMAPGIHTVRFVFAGGGSYMDIDAIQIISPLDTGVYDDTHSVWQYTGSWSFYNFGGPANNTMHYTATIGDEAALTFKGSRFILTMQRNTNRGNIAVYVDGSSTAFATINANGPELWQWTWTSPAMTPGIHTVRFVFAGGGSYMDIDAIQIISPLEAGVYDDTHGAFKYTGNWSFYNAGGPANNTMHYTGTVGDSAEVTFNGSRFILTMQRNTNRGRIDVYEVQTDGSTTLLDTINPNGPLMWQWTWTSPALSAGIHTVRLVFTGVGGSYMDIDAIQIVTPLEAGAYDDTHSAWKYNGNWNFYNAGGPANNTMHYTATAGDSADVTFNGTRFVLAMQRNTNRGLIDVYEVQTDGSTTLLTTINPNGPLMWMWTWTSPLLDPGIHTIRLVFTGVGGAYMDIDVINIIGPLEPGVYDDTNLAWQYTGNWNFYNAGGPANNTMHYTATVGDYAEVTFHGNRFILAMQRNINRGSIRVYVDGSPVAIDTIDAYGPEMWQWTWTSPLLGSGSHKVRFEFIGGAGPFMDIDTIQIE